MGIWSDTETEVAIEEEVETRINTPWRVILFDDDYHTFEDVIIQLVRSGACTADRAERHAWTVHTEGKDCVYQGDFEACFRIHVVLQEIQLVSQIEG